jgi:TonB family protein
MSGPDSSTNLSSAAGLLREQPNDARFEADLADLTARFAARSGGGLSAELSAELAFEVVLNEIVEQACLATGATGAAIVLQRGADMVCRASAGSTAPALGSRLDELTGLSGECIKTRRRQWCDDTLSDPRVDVEASQQLGVRAIVVMPLIRGTELAGVIELFSSRPYAFGVRDERTLEVLRDRTLNNLAYATRRLEPRVETEVTTTALDPVSMLPALEAPGLELFETHVVEPELMVEPEFPALDRASPAVMGRALPDSAPDIVKIAQWSLLVAGLAFAALVGLVAGRRWGSQQTPLDPGSALAASATPANSAVPAPTPTDATRHTKSSPPTAKASTAIAPGGLLVFESGKEVFRMGPNAPKEQASSDALGVQRASSVEPEDQKSSSPSTVNETRVLHRVEPQYPEDARQQNIQGTVVLEVQIGTDGAVQDVQLVGGPALLAQAAMDAVKQWRFRPQLVNGKPVEMQTRITLNFRLPQ